MKILIRISILLILLPIYSCTNEGQIDDAVDTDTITDIIPEDEYHIRLIDLDDEHPNKSQMEWMLNNYNEELSVVEKPLTVNHDSLIIKEYFFRTPSKIDLDLIFCNHQDDALIIGEQHFSNTEFNQKYGVNGAVLFVASGPDEYKVNDLLGWFAGEE
jgi:hypothetical protein